MYQNKEYKSATVTHRSLHSQVQKKEQDSFFKPVIQAKLKVETSHDAFESEADAIAERIVSMPATQAVKNEKPVAVQRKCADCKEEEKKVQRKPADEKKDAVKTETVKNEAPAVVKEVLKSEGKPLDKEVRNFMEPRFGADFSQVKIHTDTKANKSAEVINAKAFTVGKNIVFGAGQYQPNTTRGKKLIAHELVHVLQQGKGKVRKKVQRQAITGANQPVQARAHAKAFDAVRKMAEYAVSEHILFDFWAGDCRDNNKDNVVDTDRREHVEDGIHYSGTYPGFKTIAGVTCFGGWGGSVVTRDFETSVPVKYRVCADMVSRAFNEAGTGMPNLRSVSRIVDFLRHSPHFQFWHYNNFRGNLLPGDLFFSLGGGHGHIAIVIAEGSVNDEIRIIHLPGSSQLIAQGRYDPSHLNDIRIDTWWSQRPRYGIARYIG